MVSVILELAEGPPGGDRPGDAYRVGDFPRGARCWRGRSAARRWTPGARRRCPGSRRLAWSPHRCVLVAAPATRSARGWGIDRLDGSQRELDTRARSDPQGLARQAAAPGGLGAGVHRPAHALAAHGDLDSDLIWAALGEQVTALVVRRQRPAARSAPQGDPHRHSGVRCAVTHRTAPAHTAPAGPALQRGQALSEHRRLASGVPGLAG
jgi:hypothetical protein